MDPIPRGLLRGVRFGTVTIDPLSTLSTYGGDLLFGQQKK